MKKRVTLVLFLVIGVFGLILIYKNIFGEAVLPVTKENPSKATPVPSVVLSGDFKITEKQAETIAREALSGEEESSIKSVRIIVSDHAKYGKVWEVDFTLSESFNGSNGITFLIDKTTGEVLEKSNFTSEF